MLNFGFFRRSVLRLWLLAVLVFEILLVPSASLARQIVHGGTSYSIVDETADKYPELITLLLNSESIDKNERQYWFDLLPSMTKDKVDRLFDILETERKKLAEIELKY